MLTDTRFRFFQTVLKKDEKKVASLFIIEGVVTLVLLINVILLNIFIFKKLQTTAQSTSISPNPTPTSTASTLLSVSPTPTVIAPTVVPVVLNQESPIKDYFIPLGSGIIQGNDWTNVPGAQATVDFGSYQHIKSIVFETSIAVPTANESVSLRLYNVSDQHPVWYSDVTMDGGDSAYLISQPIKYDKGPKIYQVQMKTQLQYPANLTQSRIHITLQ